MIHRILVPIDGSEHASKALDFAADLAEKYDATVCLLHVAQVMEVPAETEAWRPECAPGEVTWVLETGAAETLLARAVDRLRARGATNVHQVIEQGNVAQMIIELAKREGYDLIVMGTRGLSNLGGLLGSVALKVTHAAPCTVITVR